MFPTTQAPTTTAPPTITPVTPESTTTSTTTTSIPELVVPEGWTPHINNRTEGLDLEGLFDNVDFGDTTEALEERPESNDEDPIESDRIGEEPSELPFADDDTPSQRGDDVQADAPELSLGDVEPIDSGSNPLPLAVAGLGLLALAVTAVAVTKSRNN